jgi:hypothetical protein
VGAQLHVTVGAVGGTRLRRGEKLKELKIVHKFCLVSWRMMLEVCLESCGLIGCLVGAGWWL